MRYSDHPFPPYSYVPGRNPHPRSDPLGHSFGEPEPRVLHFELDRWMESDEYLFGIDLFNAEFFWESHEQWEAAWHGAGRQGDVADFLKALIKLAAANVKRLEGILAGMNRHANRAAELFRKVNCSVPEMAGLQIDELIRIADRLHEMCDVTQIEKITLRPHFVS